MSDIPKSYASAVAGGSSENIMKTPTKGKGRPKGTPNKNKGFRGKTPKKVVMKSKGSLNLNAISPISLVNVSTDCFFNSVIQVLFSLSSFRDHVRSFNAHIHYGSYIEINAVNHIQQLFREMEHKVMNHITTHEHIMALGLPDYVEHRQCDAQECMSYILDLFYPHINDKANPKHNFVPDTSEFLIEGEEFIICSNCQKESNKKIGESLSQIEFSEPDVQHSVQLKIDDMDELYQCEHCKHTHPDGTLASQGRTLIYLNKYLIIQLKKRLKIYN